MENQEIYSALHNCGYRFLSKQQEVYIYGKPIGYGILRANIYQDKIEILLIVKGNIKNGECPNLVWDSHTISYLNDADYLDYVQIIKDCEAILFSKSPVAIVTNRLVRYDFKENPILNINPNINEQKL